MIRPPHQPPAAVVIGASAGGYSALQAILPCLPRSYRPAIIIGTHIDGRADDTRIGLFNRQCALPVREPIDKESIEPGIVFFAPPDYHILIENDRTISLSREERVNYSRPSIDVLFETAAEAYGEELVGVLLTGANCDGAEGMHAIKSCGGFTLVQDPETAEARMMPQSAINRCEIDLVLTLSEIGPWLASLDAEPEVLR